MPTEVPSDKRFSAGNKCPICGGWDGARGERRCNGFIGVKGQVYCRRVKSDQIKEFWGVNFFTHWPDDNKPKADRPKQKRTQQREQKPASRPPDLVHEYVNLDGVLVLQVLRWYEKHPDGEITKRISQRIPNPELPGEWLYKGITNAIPPNLFYKWPDLQAALELNQPVYITEGETDADAIIATGSCATTNPMGSAKFRAGHAKWIADVTSTSELYVCMDRDDAGRKHVADVSDGLLAMGVQASRIKVVRPEKGKDVRDHLEAGLMLSDLVEVPSSELEQEESTISRLRRIALHSTVESMLGEVGFAAAPTREYLIKDFLPAGIVGLVVAEGGTGKGHLMVHMGMSLALAQPFGPFDVEHECGWIYVTYEDDYDEVHRRILSHRMAVLDKLSLDQWERDAILRNVRVIDFSGEMDAVLGKDLVEVLGNARSTIPTERCVITIDPLTKILPAEIQLNTAEGAGQIMRYLWALQTDAKSNVLGVHHTRKPTTAQLEDGRFSTMHDTMGSAQLVNLSRWVLNINNVPGEELGFIGTPEAIRCEVTKSNYTSPIPPMGFVRKRGGALVWREIPEDRLTDEEAAVLDYVNRKGIVLAIDLEKQARKAYTSGGMGLSKNSYEKAKKSLSKRQLLLQSRNDSGRVQWMPSSRAKEVLVFSTGHMNDNVDEEIDSEEEDIF